MRLPVFPRRKRRIATSSAAQLLLEVPDEPTPEEAEAGLRRALGDPDLRLALWHPETASYVDAEGRPLELPPGDAAIATTRIDYESGPVAALVHDATLLEEPARLAEVTAAVRVALEKDRTLRALRASERRTRALLDALPDLMFRISASGVYLDYTAHGERDLYSPEVTGRTIWERLPRDVAASIMSRAALALAGEGLQTVEYELDFAGETREYEGRIAASGSGEFVLIVREITERKRVEGELRLERDLVRAVVDTVPTLMCGVNLDGRIIRFNTALQRLSGFVDDERVRGRPFWEVFVEWDDAVDAARAFREIADGRPREHEHAWTTVSGEPAVVAWTASWYLGEGGADRYLIAGTDVTERKRREGELHRVHEELEARHEALERQRDFLNAIANNTPSLLCLLDETGRVVDQATNRAFERLLEYDPADTGGALFWERYVASEQADDVHRRIEGAIAGEPLGEQDNDWLTSSGKSVQIAWSCTPLPALDERRLFLLSGVDVTERRRQEGEIRASRARLVEAGDAERRRLERNLHDGAQQRLVAISIALRMAKSKLRGHAPEAEPLLENATEELARALEELRELARGIHPAILTDRGLQPALVALASRSPVPVTLEAQQERMPDSVEAAAYYVVSEALANVAKYARATSVRVRVARRGGRVVVEVRDDGVGGADPAQGSGLRGLADRVAALDGRLDVDSPAAGGTRVRAEIPLS